jgi:integrase
MAKLSTTFITRGTEIGKHSDNGCVGLYLLIGREHAQYTRSWALRFKLGGVGHWMGLGSAELFSLTEAREMAQANRKLARQGINPIHHRRDQRAKAKAEQAKRMTFKEAAAGYIADNQGSWRSKVHLDQWLSSLSRYVYPVIGDLQVSDIETAHVTKILRPIWTAKAPTATRVRGRIEVVLNWATANGNRAGDNPAAWETLQHILPRQLEVEAEHHAALPYAALPAFFATLAKTEGLPSRALQALILSGTRMGDVLGARWGEFDFDQATWVIPPHTRNGNGRTTKSGKEHRVPIGPYLARLLSDLPHNDPELVFPVGHNTVRDLLHRLLPDGVHATLHGFRSTFSDWAHEHDKSDKFTEQALGHSNGSKVKRAYQRSDALNQRRPLMEDWERFCLGA